MVFVPVLLIFVPIICGVFIYLIKHPWIYYLSLLGQLVITVFAILYYYEFSGQYANTFIVFGLWDERIGISLRNDALSMSFVFLSIFMWWMVLLYTMYAKEREYNFLFFLLFLEGVFLGLLQSNDLFNMFVFLELITLLVTILIAFIKTGESFRAALYYLLLNTSGVLAFLLGIILLYNTFGSINLEVIKSQMHLVYDGQVLIKFAFVLMLGGISVKTALFPVFTWLPRAHGVAHSGISALLSGLIVKGGLYMFLRITSIFEGADFAYHNFFFLIGFLTAFTGVIFAVSQKDIKQILAYHTVSQVGIMMMGLSHVDEKVAFGGLLHIFHHAFFKSLLFLAAGIIVAQYGTKKVAKLRGVFKTMPILSVFMIVGMLSITGAPFFNGFISKSVIKYGIEGDFRYWLLYLVNIGTATSFLKMSQIFFGDRQLDIAKQHLIHYVPLLVLSFVCIMFGLFYIPISDGFFGIDLSYVSLFKLSGFVNYGITLGTGFLLYFLIVKKDPIFIKKMRAFNLSFDKANYLFVVFLVLMTMYFVI